MVSQNADHNTEVALAELLARRYAPHLPSELHARAFNFLFESSQQEGQVAAEAQYGELMGHLQRAYGLGLAARLEP